MNDGCTMVYLPRTIVQLQWLNHGTPTMVQSWLNHVRTMVNEAWLYYGCTMVVLWLDLGSRTMVQPYTVKNPCTMANEWHNQVVDEPWLNRGIRSVLS